MQWLAKLTLSDELKQRVNDRLNEKKLFMNPRTGTVQSLELWQTEKDTEPFMESELQEVKLVNERWVRVN